MITADKLKILTELTPQGLTRLIRKAGYKEDRFTAAKFVGMTNGGQFCYSCVYPGEFEDTCKVFVQIDHNDNLIAEY